MASILSKLASVEEQRELFTWRFSDVDKKEVDDLFKDFKKHDLCKRGELDEHEAMMLLEHRGSTKTFQELRAMISDMDVDNNHRISFIEWCCAVFHKPYAELNNFADEEARQAALAEARAHAEAAKAVEEEMKRAKEGEEAAARERAEAIERESKMSGVAGMAAFFKRQAEGVVDHTQTNEQRIKEEAARRKALRELKEREKAAVEAASKQKSAEDVAAEVQAASARAAEEAAAAAAAKEAEEKAARAARKAKLNEKWGGGSPAAGAKPAVDSP